MNNLSLKITLAKYASWNSIAEENLEAICHENIPETHHNTTSRNKCRTPELIKKIEEVSSREKASLIKKAYSKMKAKFKKKKTNRL